MNDNESTRHRQVQSLSVRLATYIHRFPPAWMTPLNYNTFRYGLVMLYLGTLFLVIGYHNPWVSFVKYIGLALVVVGSLSILSASGHSCSTFLRDRFGARGSLTTRGRVGIALASRGSSSDSKRGLPTYDAVEHNDLPNYDEAQALRLNPKFLNDYWAKRYGVPSNCRFHLHIVDDNDMASQAQNLTTLAQTPPPPLYDHHNAIYAISQPHSLIPLGHIEEEGEEDDSHVGERRSLVCLSAHQLHRSQSVSNVVVPRPSTSQHHFENVPEIYLSAYGSAANEFQTSESIITVHQDSGSNSSLNSNDPGPGEAMGLGSNLNNGANASRSRSRTASSRPRTTSSRPRTTSAYARSYSSSSFESVVSSTSSSSWDDECSEKGKENKEMEYESCDDDDDDDLDQIVL